MKALSPEAIVVEHDEMHHRRNLRTRPAIDPPAILMQSLQHVPADVRMYKFLFNGILARA
jgi:hypothetical protein